jgi:hypothetical protein
MMKSINFIITYIWVAEMTAYAYHDEKDCLSNEEIAAFEINLDENSQESGWTLVCDGEVIWNVPSGSLSDPSNTWIMESSCIAETSGCAFTITDSGEDGLTGDGFYSLTYGATTIAVSEYGKNVPFSERSVCFGIGCADPPLEQASADDDGYPADGDDYAELPDVGANVPDESNPDKSGYTGVTNPTAQGSDSKADQGSDATDSTKEVNQNYSNSSDHTKAIIFGCSVGAALMVLVFLTWLVLRRKMRISDVFEKDNDDDDDTMKSDAKNGKEADPYENSVVEAETFVDDETV